MFFHDVIGNVLKPTVFQWFCGGILRPPAASGGPLRLQLCLFWSLFLTLKPMFF
jgi:hypothetical protein